MVQIDIPAAFVVSMFAIDLSRKTLKIDAVCKGSSKPAAYYRCLCRSLFFAGFVIAPAGVYLLAGWPGWEQIYWSKRFEQLIHTGWTNALLPALFVMAIVMGAYLGHILGYRWLMNGKEKYLRPTYIGTLAIVAAVVIACHPSFLLVGTYDQYHNLNGQNREAMASVFSNPFSFSGAWVGVMVYFTAAMALLCINIVKENRDRAQKIPTAGL
jgi:TRAP-type C4-dicarboxylate transport system permease small subunit